MRDLYQELARAARSLGPAVDAFDRRITKAAASKSMQRAPVVRPPRLPSARANRPTAHRAALPVRYTRGTPPTVRDRVRQLQQQSGGNSIAARVRRAARRVADAVRRALSRAHDALARLRDRFTRRSR